MKRVIIDEESQDGEISKLRNALRWYKSLVQEMSECRGCYEHDMNLEALYIDAGKRAREALGDE